MADDGETYVVEYLDGNHEKEEYVSRPGRVFIKYTNGDTFEGSYTKKSDGSLCRQGKGKYVFTSGASYSGMYEDGLKSGRGTYNYPNGDVYDGMWSNNEKNGSGTYTYSNGDKFSGSYKANVKHGHGSYIYKENGAQLVGEWEKGEFVKGKWVFKSGDSYHGNFSNGKPNGKGTFYHKNGLEQAADFQATAEEEDAEDATVKMTSGDIADSQSAYNQVANPPLPVVGDSNAPVRRSVKKPSGPLGVIIAGAPASGKGTQCERIREEFNLVHLSTGDMLRAAVAAESELGMKAKELMESGQLVPDDVVIGAVKERLEQPDCQEKGFLLDGFPRTAGQAAALKEAGIDVHVFLMLNVPDEILVERVVGRRIDPDTGNSYHVKFNPPPEEVADRVIQRADDTEEKVAVRLEGFHGNIEQIREFYTDITHEIDGAVHKDEVWDAVQSALKSAIQ